ncbi:signal transduction histidine kinase [Natronocella acetinitrilica]|uniref:histidine kinase n=1 Tax=Natronocella acetinitrilica TaxID=414046 RepID=A0AAE3KDD4_9GAMM|nr:HAMP domain-containing sensor histidine kinase [Natronocella acetinitrilica]MCP1676701.1 signal transduction histidine kinase [Natronocella acetinitrilica]
MLEALSYRVRVPLNISLVVMVTVVVITVTLLGYNYRQMDREMQQSGESLGRVLAKGVAVPMLRDDLWTVWDTLRAPMDVAGGEGLRPYVITVTDAVGRVFASTRPEVFRVLSEPAVVDSRYPSADWLTGASGNDATRAGWLDDNSLLVAVPVLVDGSTVGSVLLEYQRPAFLDRFGGAVQQVVATTVMILLLILPIGWWLGMRVARPLQELAGVLDRIGNEPPSRLRQGLSVETRPGRDEIARLRGRFHDMLGQLADKEALEQEMVRADRLAALGRLTAGIAHEINNPLGGMLNALSTQRRHGHADPVTERTLSLVERGLEQVRDIVGALLVEARFQGHDLRPEDVADVMTLVQSDPRAADVRMDWEADLSGSVPLPSTPVRQILINLMLNAVRAAGPSGEVGCWLQREATALRITVCNDGAHIPEHRMEHLFEPFSSSAGDDGVGLGLWVCYQIVQQLRGRIDVRSEPGRTCFRVELPLTQQRDVDREALPA